ITFPLLIIPIAFSIEDTEIGHKCLSSSKAFTSNYNQSRALVVIDLIFNNGSHDGFRKASYTWLDDPEEWAYGLALCRGDVSPDDCMTCVNNAAITLINTHCPDNRTAIIWRDYCFFKYSDVEFFGQIDTDNRLSSMNDKTWNLINSKEAAINWLGSLTQTAVQSPKFFASGPTSLNDYEGCVTLYGVVQCTRDLSADDCKTCLDLAVTDISKCCALKEGARVVYGSCNVRYETYNFLTN
ncbi:cysteine-rich repeat secretory protein 38, partial [Phtheirospermum japonicum]